MIIGKQSTLNDLGDLKTDLEAKIAAAAAIKVGEVSQIESGFLESGNVYDERPSGVYYIGHGVERPDDSTGMLLQMDYKNPVDSDSDNSGFNVGFFATWTRELYMVNRVNSVRLAAVKMLSTNNTITDSNGFMKAA